MPRKAAFSRVFVRHYGAIVRFVERRVDDPELARDIAGECFEIAWRKFDVDAPFGVAWLFRTARNLTGNAYRRRTRDASMSEELHRGSVRVTADDGLRECDDAMDLARALATLSWSDQEILQLAYWDDLVAEEIADVLGITAGTARTRLSRARSRLRDALEASQPAHPKTRNAS